MRTAPLDICYTDIHALCVRSLDTMVKIKSWEQHTLLAQGLRRTCGQPPIAVDPLLAKVRTAMDGGRWAALEVELLKRRATEVAGTRWPCLPPDHSFSCVKVATDGSVIDGSAGSAFAIFDGPVHLQRDGDASPILEGTVKTLGRQSSNRSELLALLLALKSCRTVQDMSVLCDSLCTIQQTDRGFHDPDSFSPGTANLDLIRACVAELEARRNRGQTYEIYKVKSHVPSTPQEHVYVDELAKEATSLPTPVDHLRLLSPSWCILHHGLPVTDSDLSKTLLELHVAKVSSDLPSFLKPLTAAHVEHKWTRQLSESTKLRPSLREMLCRFKFGALKNKPKHTWTTQGGHSEHTCPRCKHRITGADTAHLNGAQWVDHILHYCTVPAIQHLRDRIQDHCDNWSGSADIDVRVQSVSEVLPLPAYQLPPDELLLDLRGFLLRTVRRQGGEFDFLPDDLAALFTKFNSELIQLDRCLDITLDPNHIVGAPSHA